MPAIPSLTEYVQLNCAFAGQVHSALPLLRYTRKLGKSQNGHQAKIHDFWVLDARMLDPSHILAGSRRP